MKSFKLKTIYSLVAILSFFHCNLSPNLNSTNKYNGLVSFLYTNEYATLSTLVLSGTLSDANGKALDSATILISNNYSFSYVQPKESVSKSIMTNSNGEFSIYLKEGKFDCKISKSNNEYLGYFTVLLKSVNETPIVESQEGKILVSNTKLSATNSSSTTSTPITTTPSTPTPVTAFKNPSSEYEWGTFTDNQNGTISFTISASLNSPYNGTNLTWMKCSVGQTYNNGICDGVPSSIFYCNTRNNNCDNGDANPTINTVSPIFQACNGITLLGKTWRVPKLMELSTMLLCNGNLALNPGQCANVGISPTFSKIIGTGYIGTASYWTSQYQAGTSFSYMVDFTFGVNQLEKDRGIALRCVSDP